MKNVTWNEMIEGSHIALLDGLEIEIVCGGKWYKPWTWSKKTKCAVGAGTSVALSYAPHPAAKVAAVGVAAGTAYYCS